MKNTLRSGVLWLSFLFAISCHKNEETPTATMTFFNDGSHENYLAGWVVVSDQSGKVLAWKNLPINVSTSLTYPTGKDSVNLTIIEKGGSNYSLYTFTNIASGNYSSPAPFPNPVILGTYKVQCPSPTEYYPFLVSSECGSTSNSDHTEYQVNVCANSSLFISISKPGVLAPRYLYNSQINANGSIAIDQTVYNSLPEMKRKDIALGDTYEGSFVFVKVKKDSWQYWFDISQSFISNTSSLPLYYPGSAFDEYFILSALGKPNINLEYGSTVTDPATYFIPTFTPTLDIVTSATTSNLSYNLSGTAHYVKTYFSDPSFSSWAIYSSFSKKISTVLPIFPDDLKKEIDFSFISTLKLQSITIGESDLGGYSSYYKNSILGQKRIKNYKTKQYSPKADGSIGGGG